MGEIIMGTCSVMGSFWAVPCEIMTTSFMAAFSLPPKITMLIYLQIRAYLEKQEDWWPVSPEFANYALALLVYSVRYPAVFWNTNKGVAFVFSLTLIINSIQVSDRISCRHLYRY